MTLTLSLLVIVALLTIHRVCKRQKLSPPPLRLPLIAAIGIPLLSKLAEIVSYGGLPMIQNSLACLLYTSPSPRDVSSSRMPSSA